VGRVIATTEGEWEGGAGSRSQGEEGKSIKKRLGEEGDGLGEGGEERL